MLRAGDTLTLAARSVLFSVEMTKRRDDDDTAAEIGGLSALGAGGLAGVRLLGALLDDGPQRSRELGPAPIGSDPWLLAEIRRAIARDAVLDASRVSVRVEEAIVTLTGSLEPAEAARLERAVRSVQGIKRLVMELAR